VKNIKFFHTIIVQRSSNITITSSFIYTSLTGSHQFWPANLWVSRSHSLAGRCQHHSNGTSGRCISCISIQLNIMVACNNKYISLIRIWWNLTIRFHLHFSKSFKQLRWWKRSAMLKIIQKLKINISQSSAATVCRWSRHVNNCCIANYFSILYTKYYRNR